MLKLGLEKLISLAFRKLLLLLLLPLTIVAFNPSSLGYLEGPYYSSSLAWSELSRICYTIAVVIITYILLGSLAIRVLV